MTPAIRFTKEEVLENLPPIMYSSRITNLSKEQNKAYNEMKHEMITLFQHGQVTEASHKAALLSKLFQICLGSVITSDADRVELDNRPRIELLVELINESQNKSVIFCNYVGAIDNLIKSLTHKNIRCAKVDGTVTGNRRDKVFQDFQHDDDLRVLVAHPLTTAYGTELAAADQLILNGPMLSGTHVYMQGMARLSSNKQESDTIQIIEVSACEEERNFFSSLRQRKSQADAVGALFKSIIERRI
jgi:SNF2 family DNA or RNA helicase